MLLQSWTAQLVVLEQASFDVIDVNILVDWLPDSQS